MPRVLLRVLEGLGVVLEIAITCNMVAEARNSAWSVPRMLQQVRDQTPATNLRTGARQTETMLGTVNVVF